MAKSVLDIEVKAEAFEKFADLFKKYDAQLSKMPGKWNKVSDAAEESTKSFDGVVEALNKAIEAMSNIAEAQDKASKNQDKFNKHAKDTEKTFKSIGGHVGGMVKGVTNLMRWGALSLTGGGLLGVGGAYGIGALSGSVSDTRRQAQGMGVSSGELKAANLNFSRYIDTESTMSSIAQAQTDPNKRWAFTSAGVNPNQSAAEALPDLMRRAVEVYKQGPESTASSRLQARGFGELGVSVSDARRLASLKGEELDMAIKRYAQDKKSLEVNDNLQKQWQDLDVQLDRSKMNIQQAFIEGLAPLIPDIEKFSQKVAEAIRVFLGNPALKQWLSDFGDGIKSAAEWLNKVFTPSSPAKSVDMSGPASAETAMNFFTGKGWTAQQAAGITGNIQAESSFNPKASNKGHKGIGQWDLSRQKDFESWSGFSIDDSRADFQKQMEFMNYELTLGKEKKAGSALRQAATQGQSSNIMFNQYERAGDASGGRREAFANAAFQQHMMMLGARKVNVTMNNNTGGSATAVIGAVATPDLGYSALAGVK